MVVEQAEVLALFQRRRGSLSLAEVMAELGLHGADRRQLQRILQALVGSGELTRVKRARYALRRRTDRVRGVLRCSPRGYGFVVPDQGEGPDLFVHRSAMGGALDGDRVVARIERHRRDGRIGGSIAEVVDRARRRVLGRYSIAPTGLGWVTPIEAKILAEIFIPPDRSGGARDGAIVEVEFETYPGSHRVATGRIVEVIGALADARIDLELVVREHELPRDFPSEVQRAAQAIPMSVTAEQRSGRRDFREQLVVTIDGEAARDFDDAVSVAPGNAGGYRLGVHVADVSSYVLPDSPLDREARCRGVSVYFPERVIPMLPEALSSGICSLLPQVDRLTLSLVVELDAEGEVRGYEIGEGVIRSQARLTYSAVDEFLTAGTPLPDCPAPAVGEALVSMAELASVLGHRRRQRGGLELDLVEGEIQLDAAGQVTGFRRLPRRVSERMIEEFMILANEVIAGHLVSTGQPLLHRVHESPDPADVEKLSRTLSAFGLEIEAGSATELSALLERVRGRREEHLVNSLVLRAMRLALYQPDNIGHYGLASLAYTHFTSPIRRYPDIVIHRLVRGSLPGKTGAARDPAELEDELRAVGRAASRLERRAEEAERQYLERKKARFMADKVGQRFPGRIVAVESFGLFVELEETSVEGLVHLNGLGDDAYRHDADAHALLAEQSGRTYRLGDRIEVEVERVDLLRGKVDLQVPGATPNDGERPRRWRRQASRRRVRSGGASAARRSMRSFGN